jgi:hypothetical protein
MGWGSFQSMSASTRCAIILRDEFVCCWCRNLILERYDIQLDHLRPLRPSRGKPGSSTPDNLVVACVECNAMRGNMNRADRRRFKEHLADRDKAIADGTMEAKRRLRLPLDRAAGRALARQWYPNRLEYLSRNQRLQLRLASQQTLTIMP